MGSDSKKIEEYQSVLDTVRFLTTEGEYELALELSQRTLERMHLEKDETPEPSSEDDKKVDAIRHQLTEKYLSVRLRMEKGALPYRQAFMKTLIVSSVISIVFIVTLAISIKIVEDQTGLMVKNLLNDTFRQDINTQMTKVTDKILIHMSAISDTTHKAIPKLLSKKFDRYPENKITEIIETSTRKIVNDKLPSIVEQKMKELQRKKHSEN